MNRFSHLFYILLEKKRKLRYLRNSMTDLHKFGTMIQNVSLKCIRRQNVILKIQDGGRWSIRLNERPVLHHDRDLFILRWRLSATSVF